VQLAGLNHKRTFVHLLFLSYFLFERRSFMERFDAIIIGGGATGAEVARDLTLRGLKTVLLERHDLSSGTSGRLHGLLHSGGRYVVKDKESARECAEESKILLEIAPNSVHLTGGIIAKRSTSNGTIYQ
jgi:glycerol-3-phosphate dehydrogenase